MTFFRRYEEMKCAKMGQKCAENFKSETSGEKKKTENVDFESKELGNFNEIKLDPFSWGGWEGVEKESNSRFSSSK